MGESSLDVDLSPLAWSATIRRAVGLLVGSTRLVLVAHLGAVVISALSGPVSAASVGAIISVLHSSGRHHSGSAVLVPAMVLGTALLVGGMTGAGLDSWGKFVIGERFTALFERAVMAGVGRIPGLGPFEDPALADTIEVTRWTAGGEFSGGGGVARIYVDTTTALRYGIGAIGAALVISRWAWWAPVVVAVAEVPAAIVAWRHSGLLVAEESAAAEPYRRAAWFLELGLDTAAAKEVRVFGLGPWLGERYRSWWLRAFEVLLERLASQLRSEIALAVARFGGVGVLLVAVVGTQRPSPGSLTAGLLALPILLTNSRALLEWPAQAHRNLARLPQAVALADLKPPTPTVAPDRGRGEIRFEAVAFTYPGTSRPVLAGVDLVVPAGSSLALVGVNGCGKTSLIKLLCRFYDPDQGRILLDGVDLRDFEPTELRRRMAAVFQEFVHYPFDILTNVGLGCLERNEVVPEALGLAGASELAQKTGSAVLDRSLGGLDLSGGEWQRVGLARAMAARLGRDALVVIADEPTAHLDVEVEVDLYRRFAELTAGRTTVLTSHRMSTVRMAERVAVMEAGRIVEEGRHDQLMAAGGLYARMYGLQAGRFRETGAME